MKKLFHLALVFCVLLVCSGFKQLDSQPVYAPVPPYPSHARANNMSGAGWYVLDIDARNGRVTRALVAVSSGHKVLDNVALRTFKQWRFKPGIARVKVPARWTLDSERK